MNWLATPIEILRVLIGDMSDTPTYTDTRLSRILVVAAAYVVNELSFDYAYSVDVRNATISPDPTSQATRDDVFVTLLSLRAANILLDSEVKYYAMSSLKVQDGPSSIDTTSRANFVKEAAKIIADQYAKTKMLHQMGDAGVAILTPYTVSRLYPMTRFQ